ncbi:hypothetical protein [Amycolatopsis magusensis]|uniref:hypothetical protein n=1 Tax=Amycolatopsis magusensis TaxID=882444 RepID=UPI003C2CD45B
MTDNEETVQASASLAERSRAADERDRLADEWDRLADERERAADDRERRADERETAADAREKSLDHQQQRLDEYNRQRATRSLETIELARASLERSWQRLARAEDAARSEAHRAAREQTKIDRETATSDRTAKDVRREGPEDS